MQRNSASKLEEIDEELKLTYSRLVEAIENNESESKISLLTNFYNMCELEYKKESEKLSEIKSSTHDIQLELNKLPMQKKIFAKPLRTFTSEDIFKINEHYKTLPKDLKKLLDAALDDTSITYEKIGNPVFIRGEGYIFDLQTVEEQILRNQDSAYFPVIDNEKKFNREDIIPCNSLISAMSYLLDIVEGKYFLAKPVEDNYHLPHNNNAVLKPEIIKIIETYYSLQIENKHRRLFDAICRDSMTNMIMQEPVLLPDGYVYDRRTADFLLEASNPACCPNMNSVKFSKEDITICHFSIAVLKQLEANILTMQANAVQNNENIEMNPRIIKY